MNRLKGELSAGNKRKHKRIKNKRWKMKNNTKSNKNNRLELLKHDSKWKWRWKEEGT